jgi:antitoxin (DNA-binding transcriptional repressor) of toxin-antitoxin stability system
MIHAGIREVKNNLSRLLLQVKAGQEIVITERGKAIARIVKETSPADDLRATLSPLIESGLIVWPHQTLLKDDISPVISEGKTASEMIIEDRR